MQGLQCWCDLTLRATPPCFLRRKEVVTLPHWLEIFFRSGTREIFEKRLSPPHRHPHGWSTFDLKLSPNFINFVLVNVFAAWRAALLFIRSLRRSTLRRSSTRRRACGSRARTRTSPFLFLPVCSRTTGPLPMPQILQG